VGAISFVLFKWWWWLMIYSHYLVSVEIMINLMNWLKSKIWSLRAMLAKGSSYDHK
jgi:hypothetical protein